MKNPTRREFIQVSSATAVAGAAALSAWPKNQEPRGRFRGTLCLFSKSVPQLTWSELGQAAKRAGFGGIDLTVRDEGHVLPARAAADLPKAVAAIREAGLEVPMITTGLLTADDPTAEAIFQTASKLSIPFLKPGNYQYKFVNVLAELDEAGRQFRGLVNLAARYGIQLGYHNHMHTIGAPVWDMARVIEPLDRRWCGFYFDLFHATADGAASAWQVSANLVTPRLKMMAVKDFVWKKKAGSNQCEAESCPLGQGVVPWKEFMQILAKSNFHGPISLHEAFAIPNVADAEGVAVSRNTVPKVMAAAKENLDYLKSLLHSAYD